MRYLIIGVFLVLGTCLWSQPDISNWNGKDLRTFQEPERDPLLYPESLNHRQFDHIRRYDGELYSYIKDNTDRLPLYKWVYQVPTYASGEVGIIYRNGQLEKIGMPGLYLQVIRPVRSLAEFHEKYPGGTLLINGKNDGATPFTHREILENWEPRSPDFVISLLVVPGPNGYQRGETAQPRIEAPNKKPQPQTKQYPWVGPTWKVDISVMPPLSNEPDYSPSYANPSDSVFIRFRNSWLQNTEEEEGDLLEQESKLLVGCNFVSFVFDADTSLSIGPAFQYTFTRGEMTDPFKFRYWRHSYTFGVLGAFNQEKWRMQSLFYFGMGFAFERDVEPGEPDFKQREQNVFEAYILNRLVLDPFVSNYPLRPIYLIELEIEGRYVGGYSVNIWDPEYTSGVETRIRFHYLALKFQGWDSTRPSIMSVYLISGYSWFDRGPKRNSHGHQWGHGSIADIYSGPHMKISAFAEGSFFFWKNESDGWEAAGGLNFTF